MDKVFCKFCNAEMEYFGESISYYWCPNCGTFANDEKYIFNFDKISKEEKLEWKFPKSNMKHETLIKLDDLGGLKQNVR